MTNELINQLLPVVKKSIVCDKLVFHETKKYNNAGKSLYAIFAAPNHKTAKASKVVYCFNTGTIEFTVWFAHIERKV